MLLFSSFNFLSSIILVVRSLVVAMTIDCKNACDFCRCCRNKNSVKKFTKFEIRYKLPSRVIVGQTDAMFK